MKSRFFRVPVAVAACAIWLGGCESLSKTADFFRGAGLETTGSIAESGAAEPAVSGPALATEDPKDDVALGKRHFRENNFGLAEQHFRRAAEAAPGPRHRDAEAWLGLAASYDRLRRFDLADRAYRQAIALAGPTPEILNNQGFSYLMRGDYRRAREKLAAAHAKDPANPYIRNNLRLLDESTRSRRKR